MGYRTLQHALDDLAGAGQLVRIEQEIDPRLEVAEIHRRVNQAGGPAILFARPKGCRFPLVSNLFGTMERTRFLFRDTLATVEKLIRLRGQPEAALRRPWAHLSLARAAWNMRPRFVADAPALEHTIRVSELPQVVSWPLDGGAFILLPQVYTEDPDQPGWRRSNLGMYRVQLSDGQYAPDREIGLHYQIHRGIGVHHAAAMRRGESLRVNIFVGGPPAMTLAAVMPLPEGFPEVAFAGALGGRRVPLAVGPGGLPVHAEADFVLSGVVEPGRLLPEGPFGDHLGYYSLAHDFPVLRVERVTHRPGAVWPFTIVGRPPQEDSCFGQFIHELTGPVIPTVIPGVKAVHAVDAAGVHPLLLAIGSERYTPYAPRTRPMELLTQAHAILGQGQMSLAKYLFIAAGDDDPALEIHDTAAFLGHLLARVDLGRDLHFSSCTTIDTLDYSGTGLNEGSKLVVAAVGPPRRALAREVPRDLPLPAGFSEPRMAMAGVLVVQGPRCPDAPRALTPSPLPNAPRPALNERSRGDLSRPIEQLAEALARGEYLSGVPLVVVVDDSEFAAGSLRNFLWVTFTRSDPAADVHGAGAFMRDKHWGCAGPLIIDARVKPWHAPAMEPDPEVSKRVDALAARGGPLHGIV